MGNVNIYDIIGTSADPIYMLLEQLKVNEEIIIGRHIIRKTEKFYEIENDDLHEGFRVLDSCYQFLDNLLIQK